jgi:hypothetical protein
MADKYYARPSCMTACSWLAIAELLLGGILYFHHTPANESAQTQAPKLSIAPAPGTYICTINNGAVSGTCEGPPPQFVHVTGGAR